MGVGVVGSLGFDVQGLGGGVLPSSDPFGQTEKGGRGGYKNWTFFLDVINAWSLNKSFAYNDVNLIKLY